MLMLAGIPTATSTGADSMAVARGHSHSEAVAGAYYESGTLGGFEQAL